MPRRRVLGSCATERPRGHEGHIHYDCYECGCSQVIRTAHGTLAARAIPAFLAATVCTDASIRLWCEKIVPRVDVCSWHLADIAASEPHVRF